MFRLFYRPCFFFRKLPSQIAAWRADGAGFPGFFRVMSKRTRCVSVFAENCFFLRLWGENGGIRGKPILREAFAQLCVQFRGCAWCVRWGIYDHARFL